MVEGDSFLDGRHAEGSSSGASPDDDESTIKKVNSTDRVRGVFRDLTPEEDVEFAARNNLNKKSAKIEMNKEDRTEAWVKAKNEGTLPDEPKIHE